MGVIVKTPNRIPDLMAQAATLKHGMLVLDPCAGPGGELILAAARVAAVRVDALGLDPSFEDSMQELRPIVVRSGAALMFRRQDARSIVTTPPIYDAVLMNPGSEDCERVAHAWGFVKPGGVLVALLARGLAEREAEQGLIRPLFEAGRVEAASELCVMLIVRKAKEAKDV